MYTHKAFNWSSGYEIPKHGSAHRSTAADNGDTRLNRIYMVVRFYNYLYYTRNKLGFGLVSADDATVDLDGFLRDRRWKRVPRKSPACGST